MTENDPNILIEREVNQPVRNSYQIVMTLVNSAAAPATIFTFLKDWKSALEFLTTNLFFALIFLSTLITLFIYFLIQNARLIESFKKQIKTDTKKPKRIGWKNGFNTLTLILTFSALSIIGPGLFHSKVSY